MSEEKKPTYEELEKRNERLALAVIVQQERFQESIKPLLAQAYEGGRLDGDQGVDNNPYLEEDPLEAMFNRPTTEEAL